MKKKLLFWIKIIFINLLVLFFILCFFDRLIPLITDQKSGIARTVNIREHNPSSSYHVKVDIGKVDINTDKNGFILGNTKPINNEIDYVFVGGSTTECFNVDESKRFPFLSIKLLNNKTGKSSYGFNASYGGNNLMHSYIVLLTKLLVLKPKNIVLMHAVNDFAYLLKNEDYFHGPRALLNNPEINLFSSLKKIKDNLFPNIYRSLRSISMMQFLGRIPGSPYAYSNHKIFAPEDNLNKHSKILDLFIETCEIYNINLILMTQFNNLNNISQNEYLLYKSYNQQIRNKAESNNIQLIDLDSLVPKNFEMMYDGIHLTNKGSILVSQLVAKSLLEY